MKGRIIMKEKIFQIVCLMTSILLLSYLTFWAIGAWELRVSFYCLALIAAFLHYSKKRLVDNIINTILTLLVLVFWIYTMWGGVPLIQRAGTFPTTGDVIFGTIIVALTFELGRRTTGWILPIIFVILLIYGLFGKYFPGFLYHRGISYVRMISYLYSPTGVFGELIGIVGNFVFVFVTFGAFLNASKTGSLLVKLADTLMGKMVGGPAKAAVVASSLMGMITGSTVSNVMTVGTITIPLMKSTGIRSSIAAAIEAVASTGGQIMPPVMGAAAFVMAENLAMPYNKVALAGFIPAILYYSALYAQIHLYTLNRNITGSTGGGSTLSLLKSQGYLLVPLFVLVYLMFVTMTSAVRAGLWAILATLVLSWIRRETRMGFKKTIRALIGGIEGLLSMIGICAVAAIVIQLLDVTGLGLIMTDGIIKLGAGNFWIIAIFIALIVIVLGMGMPTVPAYILAAVVAAPVLINLGVHPFIAHFYIFYYACLSSITPPVALGAYAASSIAQSDPWITGWIAVRLGFVGFLVPFALLLQPPLLLLGEAWEVIYCLFFAMAGIISIALSFEGHVRLRLHLGLRILMFISGVILFVTQSLKWNLICFIVSSGCVVIAIFMKKRELNQGVS